MFMTANQVGYRSWRGAGRTLDIHGFARPCAVLLAPFHCASDPFHRTSPKTPYVLITEVPDSECECQCLARHRLFVLLALGIEDDDILDDPFEPTCEEIASTDDRRYVPTNRPRRCVTGSEKS